MTSENYKTYFETNEYVKYLLFGMPRDVTLTTIANAAKGSVTRNPEQETYKETNSVVLTALGKSGYVFSHWSGDFTGASNPATVVIDKNMTITANFSDPDFSKPLVIEAPGSGSFTIPAGIDSVSIKVWGGGGSGGSASNGATALQSRGGGGAGAGYAQVKKKVTAGQVLTYTLGAGGKEAPTGFANISVDAVQNGSSSQVSLNSEVIALAQGGPGGQNIAGAFSSGNGGIAPKSGNVGDVVFYGGNGGNGNSTGTGGGGGSAGALGNGGNGGYFTAGTAGAGGGAEGGVGINSTNVGNPGKVPGAGGSGAAVRASANMSLKGGDGGNGKIIFNFSSFTSAAKLPDLNQTISIYPNPATDKIYINTNGQAVTKIQLVDLYGKVVYSAIETLPDGGIDVSGFASGLYVLKVHSADSIYSTKVLKE